VNPGSVLPDVARIGGPLAALRPRHGLGLLVMLPLGSARASTRGLFIPVRLSPPGREQLLQLSPARCGLVFPLENPTHLWNGRLGRDMRLRKFLPHVTRILDS